MKRSFVVLVVLSLLLLSCGAADPTQVYQTDDANAPTEVVKLIFIHHSTGENWLTDGYGNLGKTLGQNNYFVSDTNYGWGPNSIGDRTDIPDWTEWFASADTPTYMQALYTENGKHSTYTRTLPNPGGENEIIMFKSCFPNSDLSGNPDDPPSSEVGYTVGHAKYVYNTLLGYFGQHTDKLFVVITAPPLSDATNADNARAFNNWLVYNWLWENNYEHGNVVVFDFYNVLTHADYHHRFYNGEVQHIFGTHNTNYYPSSPGDDHPSVAGSRKATEEFVSLLNVYYQRWQAGARNLALTANQYQDGWILESTEDSTQGGTLNNTGATLLLGDDSGNRQYRAIISFNTAPLPDNAVIVAALLKVRQKSVIGTDPFKTHGNLIVDIRKGTFSSNSALQLSDFKAAASRFNVASVNKTAVNKWHNAWMLTSGFGQFNLTGITQFRLRFTKDDNNDNGRDYRAFYSANSANKPALWITYYQPSGSSGGLIQPGDLSYLGAFRLPNGPAEFGWYWSGEALTFYPDGDPAGQNDGFPGSLYGTGHNWNTYVSEISIPPPVISTDLNALNTAVTLQSFADIRGGLFGYLEIPRVGLAYLPAQGSQTSGKLYFAWAQHMGETDTGPTHGWSELNLSNPQTKGTWRVGNYQNYVTGDYLFAIPKDWADANIPGKYLGTGRYRDGGQGALGPSIIAIAPWQSGNPPAPGTTLPATPLLLYGSVYDAGAPAMNGYSHADEWSGAAWLTAGANSAVIFVGTKGLGNTWYGCKDGTIWPDEPPFPPDCPERGWWSERFEGQILFYDPSQLSAVSKGQMETWQPQPYATLNIDDLLFNVTDVQQKSHVGAAAFDYQNGLLYIMEVMVDNDKPIIHVWRVSE